MDARPYEQLEDRGRLSPFFLEREIAPQNAALGEGRESGAVGNEMALEAAVFPSRSLVRPCSVAPSRLFHASAGRGLAGGAEKSFLLGGRSIVLSASAA